METKTQEPKRGVVAAIRERLAAFARDEQGQVIVEYVTLLLGVFIAVYATVAPFESAMRVFAREVFVHLNLP